MKSGASLLGLAKYIYYDFLLFFMLTGCNGCSESDSKWRREAIERYKTRVTKSRKRITYFLVPKKYYRVCWAQRVSSKVWLEVI